MKIIITEEQLLNVKSFNGLVKYIEDYLSQFEHFVKMDVNVYKAEKYALINMSDDCVVLSFVVYIDGPIRQGDLGDEIFFAINMFFPRGEDDPIDVLWETEFKYV
jgi:hypothetical protein